MAVGEEERHRVFEAFKDSYGAEVASSIMEMMPPAGVPELATKDDVAALGRELRGELRAELHGQVGVLRAEMDGLEARLGERIEGALKEQATRFIRWTAGVVTLLVSAGTAVAVHLAGSGA